MRKFRPGDCVHAIIPQPDLALALTCEQPSKWRVTVFDLRAKKAAITDHFEASLEQAKQFALRFAAERYGIDLENVCWRESLTFVGSGAAG